MKVGKLVAAVVEERLGPHHKHVAGLPFSRMSAEKPLTIRKPGDLAG